MKRWKDWKPSLEETNRVSGCLALIGILLTMPFSMDWPWSDFVLWTLFIIGLALIIAGIVILKKFWRCPHCKASLPTRGINNMEFCPACSKKLEE